MFTLLLIDAFPLLIVGTRLGRGYFEEADTNSAPPTFTHLCFVVHGIGQKACKDKIVKDCDV